MAIGVQIGAPWFSPSTAITVQARNAGGGLMARNTNILFNTHCNLPCRTCADDDPRSCESCYSNSSLVSGRIFLMGSTCSSTCPPTQYLDT